MKANHNYRLSVLLLAMLLSPAALLAQPHSASGAATPFGTAVDTTLVREYDGRYSLGCMVNGGMPVVYAVAVEEFANGIGLPALMSGYLMPLPYGWTVSDMRVLGDSLYFCGTDGSGNALFGWLQANVLCAGGMPTVHHRTLFSAKRLNRMAVVRQGAAVRLLAVGEIDSCDCIVDWPDINGTACNQYDLPWPGTHREQLMDVVVEGQYALFLGIDSRPGKTMCLRRARITTAAMDTAGLKTVHYYYPLSPYDRVLPESRLGAVPLGGGRIAVADQTVKNPLQEAGIDISVIDVHTLDVIRTQQYVNQHRVFISGLVRIPATGLLAVLYNHINSYSAVWLSDPVQTVPYTATRILDASRIYLSIDRLGTDSYQTAVRNRWQLQRTLPAALQNPCQVPDEVTVQPITPYQHVTVDDVGSLDPVTYAPGSFTGKVTPLPVQRDCFQ